MYVSMFNDDVTCCHHYQHYDIINISIFLSNYRACMCRSLVTLAIFNIKSQVISLGLQKLVFFLNIYKYKCIELYCTDQVYINKLVLFLNTVIKVNYCLLSIFFKLENVTVKKTNSMKTSF